VRQQTDSNRFFVTREALLNPNRFIRNLMTIEDNIQETLNTLYHSRKKEDD
jgi:hypothetical protein